MPRFETYITVPPPVEIVFDFFRRPANLLRVTPPDLHLKILEGPEVIELGSRLVLQARRWGLPQRVETVVTSYRPNETFVDEQRQGPFRKWIQTHLFAAVPEGTRVAFQIDFEPPGGALGFLVTARAIETELKTLFAYRTARFRELLG